MGNPHFNLMLVILVSISHQTASWGLFMRTDRSDGDTWTTTKQLGRSVAEFSMDDAVDDPKGIKLLEKSKWRLTVPNSCWQNAYHSLYASCSEIAADKEKQSRLAWHLSDCFQKDTGRPAFPSCHPETPMMNCLTNLDELAHKIYLEFFLETNSICHQLQTDAFKHETERLVNDLKRSAQFAEDKLEIIEERSESLLQSSNCVQDSLISIDLQTQKAARASKDIAHQINEVLKQSAAIFEQSKGVTASQHELRDRQAEMKAKMGWGIELLQEYYEHLGDRIEKLKEEAVKIEKEINEVSESMSLKIIDIQIKADDIGNIAGMTLDKQKQLLDSQSVALQGLDFLTQFQTQALEESRATLQKLADLGHRQQEELLQRQEQLEQVHDHLIQNSHAILAAQEEFESKQAIIFTTLDKLLMLHNSMLLESRLVKSFLFYACVSFTAYMLTSTKQTSGARTRVYLGMCVMFMIEFAIIRLAANDLDQQTWISSNVFLVRSSFLLAAAVQILHSIFTYRDYEVINHQMLSSLMDKFNTMERATGKHFLTMSTESSINFYSWMGAELPEDVDSDEDPDYRLPEEVNENSIICTSVTRRYNLRPRFHP